MSIQMIHRVISSVHFLCEICITQLLKISRGQGWQDFEQTFLSEFFPSFAFYLRPVFGPPPPRGGTLPTPTSNTLRSCLDAFPIFVSSSCCPVVLPLVVFSARAARVYPPKIIFFWEAEINVSLITLTIHQFLHVFNLAPRLKNHQSFLKTQILKYKIYIIYKSWVDTSTPIFYLCRVLAYL